MQASQSAYVIVMQIFVNIIVFLLLVMIKIGDLILLTVEILLKICRKIFFLCLRLIDFIGLLFYKFFGLLFTIIKTDAHNIKSAFSKIQEDVKNTGSSPYKLAKKKKAKKHKTNMHVSFHLGFFTKIRYFITGGIFSLIIIGAPLTFYVFIQSLPNPNQLITEQIPQTTKIYDRNHVLLYQIYANQNRTLVHLRDVPNYLREGTIAIEDKDFYTHPGFDITAIFRSFLQDVSGKQLQGGSTITQQLIKSTLLTPQTSITRKIKEIVLAFWAERIYSKNQILEMYFNVVPYGGTAWGVEAASETYFGIHVSDLDLAQSAFLAGLPQAPTIYSPFGSSPNAWKARQKEVLDRMQQLGYISKPQETQALSEQLQFQSPQTPILAPHFVMYVRDLLIQKYGLPLVEKGGLTVITSLDTNMQNEAQKIVSNEVQNDAYLNISNGAALITNPSNGDILAMIGSKDYSDPNYGAVNIATSPRQPGSSIKAVTYSSALSNGFTAATILDDSPVTYTDPWGNSYSPVNYDGKFHGKIPLRIALANSFNIPAVKTLNQIGIPTMISYAKQMGITTWGSPSNYGLSITLGAAEVKMTDMAEVYGTLANGGLHVGLNPILKISDANGNILEQKNPDNITSQRVLSQGVSYIMSDILADNNARTLEFGPNSPLYIPGEYVSVKTGTTDDKRDNWTDGYTKNRVVITWVGNNDNTPMSQALASGITGAAPIWHAIMTSLLQNQVASKPPAPEDIVSKQCYGHVEYFVKGTENSVNCSSYQYGTPTPTIKKS